MASEPACLWTWPLHAHEDYYGVQVATWERVHPEDRSGPRIEMGRRLRRWRRELWGQGYHFHTLQRGRAWAWQVPDRTVGFVWLLSQEDPNNAEA